MCTYHLSMNSRELISKIRKKVENYMKKHYSSGHDFSHVIRVYNLCKVIGEKEGAAMLILEAVSLCHDLGRWCEKDNPRLDHAKKSAEIASKILEETGFPTNKIPHVLYCIKSHRFSKKIKPITLEAQILQDADRLDICGAIGIATTFAHGGAINSELYNVEDPFFLNKKRKLDDKKYVLDHFFIKLLKLPNIMYTKTAKKLAKKRREFMKLYLKQFKREIEGTA